MSKEVDKTEQSSDSAPPKDETTTEDTKPLSSEDVLKKALEDAQAKVATLEAELGKTKQLYDTKVNEHRELLEELGAVKAECGKQLASQLVTMQMQLGKPSVKQVKDAASFEAAVNELAERSVDSLQDSVNDLVPELSQSFVDKGLPSFLKDTPQGKPATQGRVTDEHKNAKEEEPKEKDPGDLI